MLWRFTPYAIPEIVSAVVLLWLAIITWRRRATAGAIPFLVILLAAIEYSLGYVLQLGSPDLPAVLFWNNIEWLGVVLLPPAWLIFVLQYTGQTRWLTRRLIVLLAIIPLITLLLAWTNNLHGLVYSNARLDRSVPFSALVTTYGIWFWVFVLYTYGLLLLGAILIGSFIRTLMRSASLYRGQAIALLIAVVAPWVGNAISLFGPRPLYLLDFTPVGFTITSLAMAWSLFRYRLLDLAPVARNVVVESMSDAVIVIDLHHRITDLNPAAERLIGRSRSEVMGQSSLQAASAWSEQIRRFYNLTSAHEELVLTIDGAPHYFDLRISPLTDSRGSDTGRLVVLRDITERKQVEQAARASEARQGAILQTALDAIITIDHQGNILEFNPAAEQMFGYKRDEVLNQELASFIIPPSFREQHRQGLERYCATGEGPLLGQRIEITALHADGTEFPIEIAITRIPIEGPALFTGYIRDITERKQALEALEQARAAAEAANEAKSAFLAMMSHEIRTPMNAIIGMTGLLLDTPLTSEQNDYAETVRASSDALLTIINDILDFSKIEAGKLELEHQPFDLRECVESALDLLATRATEKGIDLAYLLDEQVPAAVYGDVTRLRQVLVNLLSNAVKFTRQGEVVLSVTARRRDEEDMVNAQEHDGMPVYEIHFAVRDTGIGISEEGKARLFRSFSQVDASTTRRYGGTGLGLAISKRLAELMGGTMEVESQPGVGSTFHFTIQAQAAPARIRPYLDTSQPYLAGKRILIVDDNATNRSILTLQTQSWGMLPYTYASGQEALAQIRAGTPFDVAILDMQMPDMDGLTLAEQIRRSRNAQALPLIMLTSLGRRDIDTQNVQFAAFLHKPIKPSHLYNALVSVFAEQQHTQSVIPQTETTGRQLDAGLGQRLPLHILLAEDNTVNQKLALRLLERMGYRADVVANGLEVLEAVQRQRYDVILMDVQMPEMDGLEATRAIHEHWPPEQRPRIVAMTANAMQGDREECLAAGMDDYLTKPIQVNALQKALERSGLRVKRRTGPLQLPQQPSEGATLVASDGKQEDSIPALDPKVLAELRQFQVEGDTDIVQELAEAFRFETPPLLKTLHVAVTEEQPELLRRTAHNLKGSSNNLGAHVMAEISAQLEAHGKNGTVEGASELITHLEQEYRRVCQALANAGAEVK